MSEFQYTSIKKMDPKPGVKYATEYYKQTPSEYALVKLHVHEVATAIMAKCQEDSSYKSWTITPLKKFPKTKGKYTVMEILTDMLEQLASNKDIPSGMLSRWNRLFGDTEWDIVMTTEVPVRVKTTYGALFYA